MLEPEVVGVVDPVPLVVDVAICLEVLVDEHANLVVVVIFVVTREVEVVEGFAVDVDVITVVVQHCVEVPGTLQHNWFVGHWLFCVHRTGLDAIGHVVSVGHTGWLVVVITVEVVLVLVVVVVFGIVVVAVGLAVVGATAGVQH